jgi:hypothetical protein
VFVLCFVASRQVRDRIYASCTLSIKNKEKETDSSGCGSSHYSSIPGQKKVSEMVAFVPFSDRSGA